MSRSELKGIVGRIERNRRVIRQLECGHEQVEPIGSRAPFATHAKCARCNQPPAKAVIGECTAIVLPLLNAGKSRPCGKPAKFEKRGQPRCSYHFHRGAR